MRPDKMDFLLAGVGGQGVLTASDIICETGLAVGYDAKKSEIHGFSQRGGVVDSHVRWGARVYAPIAEKGAIDVIVAFELLEAARWLAFLKPGGLVIANSQQLVPMSVMTAGAVYPPAEDIERALRQAAGAVADRRWAGQGRRAGQPAPGQYHPHRRPLGAPGDRPRRVAGRHRAARAAQARREESPRLLGRARAHVSLSGRSGRCGAR